MQSFIASEILKEGGIQYQGMDDPENYFLELLLGFYFVKRLGPLLTPEKFEEISWNHSKLLKFGLAYMRAERGAEGYSLLIGVAGKVVGIETPTGDL